MLLAFKITYRNPFGFLATGTFWMLALVWQLLIIFQFWWSPAYCLNAKPWHILSFFPSMLLAILPLSVCIFFLDDLGAVHNTLFFCTELPWNEAYWLWMQPLCHFRSRYLMEILCIPYILFSRKQCSLLFWNALFAFPLMEQIVFGFFIIIIFCPSPHPHPHLVPYERCFAMTAPRAELLSFTKEKQDMDWVAEAKTLSLIWRYHFNG